MKYRPEIDGLRAVAVLAVIFFHAGISFFSGGFVGVDVFFVISGFLITSILLRDIEAGSFSIVHFYERRIRRILPALTIVILVSLPFAYYFLLPSQLEEFSESLAAVSMFYSNFLFWLKTGYFELDSELRPLLHTWSLAVEEQYYLFFPLLLFLISRVRIRKQIGILTVLFIGSISLAKVWENSYPMAAFYLLPARLWEILLGSFVAFYSFHKKKETSNKELPLAAKQILSALGLALIFYSIFAYDENTPFPGFYALVPTLGTALIILFASEKTITHKFLQNKLFVGIGLISYSAYLWHQPVFVFARILNGKDPDNNLVIALIILSLGLAYLSWKYVETPFRDKSRFSRRKIFQYAAVSTFVIIGIGVVGFIGEGFGNRIAPNGMTYAELDGIAQANRGIGRDCGYEGPIDKCKTNGSPEILIWGDSYAMHLAPGILASNPDAGIAQMTMSMCGPILESAIINSKHPRSWAEDCNHFNDNVIEWLEDNPNVKYVVLSSPFRQYFNSNNDMLVNGEIMPTDFDLVVSQFRNTLSTLSQIGVKPVVFAPPPTNGDNLFNCLVSDVFFLGLRDCRISLEDYQNHQKVIIPFLKEIEKEYPVVWLGETLCDDAFCETELGDVFIYRDTGHLSIEGSAFLGTEMDFYRIITSQ